MSSFKGNEVSLGMGVFAKGGTENNDGMDLVDYYTDES